jgi:hypothetical protein
VGKAASTSRPVARRWHEATQRRVTEQAEETEQNAGERIQSILWSGGVPNLRSILSIGGWLCSLLVKEAAPKMECMCSAPLLEPNTT